MEIGLLVVLMYTMEDATFVQTQRPLLTSSSGYLDGPRWSRSPYLEDPRLSGSAYWDDRMVESPWRRGVLNDDLRFPASEKLGSLPRADLQKPLGSVGFPRTVLNPRSLCPAQDFENYVAAHHLSSPAGYLDFSSNMDGLPLARSSSALADPLCMTRSRHLDDRRYADDPLWAPASRSIDDPMWRRSALDGRLLYRSLGEERNLRHRSLLDDRLLRA